MPGYDSEAELRKPDMTRDVYHDARQRQPLIEAHSQKDEFHNVEVQWKRKDSKIITALLKGRPVRAPTKRWLTLRNSSKTLPSAASSSVSFFNTENGSRRPVGRRRGTRL